jgi:outer membrane protein assembly factor BamE (lipoprotein component of BamABCDE complex)
MSRLTLGVDNHAGIGAISASNMVKKNFPLSRAVTPILTGLVIAFALAGCGPPDDLRGNNPDKKLMSEIKPGVTDKASVTKLLGSPSSVASFDANTWYYISQETQNVAFFKPRLKDEKVVSISFNKKGIVENIVYVGMQDHRDIQPNPDSTPAPGRKFTILEQLIGNFGRFTAPDNSGGASPTSAPGGL